MNAQSKLQLHSLNVRQDRNRYIVEDLDRQEFYEMPEICVRAIREIELGRTLREIEQILIEAFPLEDVHMLDFGHQLLELDLVYAIDGRVVKGEREDGQENRQIRSAIPRKTARIFFNPWMNGLYAILLICNIAIVWTAPRLFPHYQDLFVFDSMALNILLFLPVSIVLVMFHEFGHILAARSYGLPARLSLGHRLFFIVMETEMNSVWRLKRKERMIPYLAGLCFDQVIVFAALMTEWLAPADGYLSEIMGWVVLNTLIRMIYQCCFYMKTDLYYIFENATGCYNVMEEGKVWLRGKLPFLRAAVKATTFEEEGRVIRWYAIFYVLGVGLTVLLFAFYFIPQSVYILVHTLPNLLQPMTNSLFWDAVALMAVAVMMLGLILYSWSKKFTRRSL